MKRVILRGNYPSETRFRSPARATAKPRLLLLAGEFPPGPGGIGTHAYEVSRHLARLGWEVTVVTSQDFAPAQAIRRFNDEQPFRIVTLTPIPGPPIEAVYRLVVAARCALERRPDVIIASGERSVWLASILASSLRVPWVAIGHAMEFCVPARWQRALTRWSCGKADGIVCVSRYTSNAMRGLGVEPKQDAVIPNGADDGRFRALPAAVVARRRTEMGLDGCRVIVTVGSVSDRKGQEVVVRALPRVLERIPSAHYVMVGRPVKQEELTRLARSLGVGDHVTFAGQVDAEEVVEILNLADVFAMTSRHTPDGDFEGFGIAVLEAALCGKPAVVSADSGLEEAIVHGETGFAVPQNDHAATADAIVNLLDDDRLRMRFGKAARDRAAAGYTWSRCAQDYDDFLRQVARIAH